MAHAGSAKPCIKMRVENLTLWQGTQQQSPMAVMDEGVCIARILGGEEVYVSIYGGMHTRVADDVSRTLEVLRQSRERNNTL
jgi:hypothetical protein